MEIGDWVMLEEWAFLSRRDEMCRDYIWGGFHGDTEFSWGKAVVFNFHFSVFIPPAENAELAEIFGMACWMSHSL